MSDDPKISELKSIVNEANLNYSVTETCYKRFLVGYKGNPEKAAKALIETIKWRISDKVDEIIPDDFKIYGARLVVHQYGIDKNQRPVVNVIINRHDKSNRDINEFVKCAIYTVEQAVKTSKPDEEKYTVLYDLSTFTFQNMDFEACRKFLHILQTHYPECLGTAYIIDAPYIFAACWNIIKRWIDPVTVAKYVFIKHSEILNIVDYDNLSKEIIDIYQLEKPIVNETEIKIDEKA